MLEKTLEDVVGGLSIVSTSKAVFFKTFIRKSINICKSIVGIDLAKVIHIRCVNLCPPFFVRVGISIQRQIDSHLDKTRPVALKLWSLTNKTRLHNRELLYNRQTEKNRPLQCWWLLFSLQHSVPSNGLPLLILSLSRSATDSHRRWYSTWW